MESLIIKLSDALVLHMILCYIYIYLIDERHSFSCYENSFTLTLFLINLASTYLILSSESQFLPLT